VDSPEYDSRVTKLNLEIKNTTTPTNYRMSQQPPTHNIFSVVTIDHGAPNPIRKGGRATSQCTRRSNSITHVYHESQRATGLFRYKSSTWGHRIDYVFDVASL
jgi:hypothetical protein